MVNIHHKVRIANFGLSKKFSDITRNITHNLENIRYMAPEKLLTEENGIKKKKVPYDSNCEIYRYDFNYIIERIDYLKLLFQNCCVFFLRMCKDLI